jgi:uncharacterized protein
MSNVHIATVQSIYEAFGRGDVGYILEQLADDVAWDQDGNSWGIPWYEPRHGRDAVAGFFTALSEGLILHRLEPTNMLVGGNQVAVTLAIETEVKGTGVSTKDLEVHLWTFGDDGKITRFAHILDRHAHAAGVRGDKP